MGLFDALAGQASEALGGALGGALSGALGGGAQELASPQNLQALAGLLGDSGAGGLGGIAGLVQQFSEKGLGDIIQSWMGDGQSLPISVEQLSSVLHNEQVQAIAKALGFEPEQALQSLVALLPQAVKLLSAGGEGGAGGLLAQGLSMLGGLRG
jgi:uncharacterized protein YidB (DUF937 family)